MQNFQNESSLDRLIRAMAAELLFVAGYFWLGGLLSLLAYAIGLIALVTAVSGFCALYKLMGVDTKKNSQKPLSKYLNIALWLAILALPIAGSYYSAFFTRKIFLEDYNRMNGFYKQTLFNTGQDKREESRKNYDGLAIEFPKFQAKYAAYKPYAIKQDKNFNNDMAKVAGLIQAAKDPIYNNGDLPALHKQLEDIRPIFQDILKRNGFSLLAVALVDFHDVMENVIAEADAKNTDGVLKTYAAADEKLKAVEAEADDEEIKAIRGNLDALKSLAQEGKTEELSKKAAELKASFVKVYLKRG